MTTEHHKNQCNVYLYYETVTLNLLFSPFYAPYFTKAATKTIYFATSVLEHADDGFIVKTSPSEARHQLRKAQLRNHKGAQLVDGLERTCASGNSRRNVFFSYKANLIQRIPRTWVTWKTVLNSRNPLALNIYCF